MRTAEWMNLTVFSFFFIAAWLRPVTSRSRIVISIIAATGVTLVIAVQFTDRFLLPFAVSVIRDWLPGPLMLMVYRQAGRSSGTPNERFQNYLRRVDRKWVGPLLGSLAISRAFSWVSVALELAYLSCYVLVPFGLGVLYLAHIRKYADEYWLVILTGTYPCYIFTALVPTKPPREMEADSAALRLGKIRTFNLWIIRRASIHLNTFPSAHVTATLGASLVLLRHTPSIGLAFLIASIGIAIGAVTGRYHYAVDVLSAAALALTVFGLEILFV